MRSRILHGDDHDIHGVHCDHGVHGDWSRMTASGLQFLYL